VVPIPTRESVRSPHTVLENQPREEFAFRGCPSFPNRGKLWRSEGCLCRPKQLCRCGVSLGSKRCCPIARDAIGSVKQGAKG
jgi:hypothetical protein